MFLRSKHCLEQTQQPLNKYWFPNVPSANWPLLPPPRFHFLSFIRAWLLASCLQTVSSCHLPFPPSSASLLCISNSCYLYVLILKSNLITTNNSITQTLPLVAHQTMFASDHFVACWSVLSTHGKHTYLKFHPSFSFLTTDLCYKNDSYT